MGDAERRPSNARADAAPAAAANDPPAYTSLFGPDPSAIARRAKRTHADMAQDDGAASAAGGGSSGSSSSSSNTTTTAAAGDNCLRLRPDEEGQRMSKVSTRLVGQTVSPFLREHIPGAYSGAPEKEAAGGGSGGSGGGSGDHAQCGGEASSGDGAAAATSAGAAPAPNTTTTAAAAAAAPTAAAEGASLTHGNPNTRYCYRHRPDSKYRRAADEHKMAKIQSVGCRRVRRGLRPLPLTLPSPQTLSTLPPVDQQAVTTVWSLFSAAPAKHRQLMLQGLVTQSCFSQLSIMASLVQEQLKIDFLTALPRELAIMVLTHLDTASLCRAAQVSRQWRGLSEDDQVWKHMCRQHIDKKCTTW
jgi:F-box/WD-40 domain protein MET30